MGCLLVEELSTDGLRPLLALVLILLLMAVLVTNFLYWLIIRSSSVLLPPKLTMMRYIIQTVIITQIVAHCFTLPNDIFLFTRDPWHLQIGICKVVAVVFVLSRNAIACLFLLSILDRFVAQKFPTMYKRYFQKSRWIIVSIAITWLVVVVITLPYLAAIFNNDDWPKADCDTSVQYTHGLCGFLYDSGLPIYQFLAMWLLPSVVGTVFIIITWKEKNNTPVPFALATVQTNQSLTPNSLNYQDGLNNEIYDEEIDEISNNAVFSRSNSTVNSNSNSELLHNLPPATTRFTTLPHLENDARLQLLRQQLQSRAGSVEVEGRATPVIEAWPGQYVNEDDDRPCSSQMSGGRSWTPGSCDISIRSPPPAYSSPINQYQPYSIQEPFKSDIKHTTPGPDKGKITPVEQYHDQILRSLSPLGLKPRGFEPALKNGYPQKPADRRYKRHARLRQKWKVRSLKKSSILPPIQGVNNEVVSPESNSSSLEVMDDHTPLLCEQESLKLVVGNFVIFLASALPFEILQMFLSTCPSCQGSVILWILLKTLIPLASVLTALYSCRQHPALSHTVRFQTQRIKTKCCK